jgi:hypothetical protein
VTSVFRFAWLLAAAGIALSGQRLLMYSEFQRVRPDGEVAQADRVDHRRELISPAVARNAFTTWRIAVEAPPGAAYHLYIGQNPDDTAKVTLYQEEYSSQGEEWLPDRVKPQALPHSAVLSEGQKVQSYLLDVWIPDSAPVGRFRLEVQLNIADRWVIYPLEVRVQQAMAPANAAPAGPLPGPASRADQVVRAAACEFTRSQPAAKETQPLDRAAAFVNRNARQDLMIAKTQPAEAIHALLLNASGFPALAALCEPAPPAPKGAEWWLRFRDQLYQRVPVP